MKLLRFLSTLQLFVSLFGIVAFFSERIEAQQPVTKERVVDTDQVMAVAFSPDSKLVAGGGFAKDIKVWDAQTGKLVRTLVGHSRTVRAVAFAPLDHILASGGDDHAIRIWDAQSGDLKHTISGLTGDVYSLAFSPDGKTIASASSKWLGPTVKGESRFTGEVKLWDARTGTLKRKLKFDDFVLSVAYSPDGKTIATSGSDVRIWDAETGTLKRSLKPERGGVHAVAISRDGKILVGGGTYSVTAGQGTVGISEVRFWNAQTGELQRTLTELSLDLASVAFSPDGKILVTGTSGPSKTSPDQRLTWVSSEMKLWDAQTGELLRTVEGDLGRVSSIAFSPDGKTIVYCDYETVTLVDAETGQKKLTLMKRTTRPIGR